MRAATVIIAFALLGTGSTATATTRATTYFRVSLRGSAGQLRLGMTRADARSFLKSPTQPNGQGGIKCARYVMGSGARAGTVGACFGRSSRVVAFAVSGPAFCFARFICANGRDVIPRSVLRLFRNRFDPSVGIYSRHLRTRLPGGLTEIVMEGPATDPAGTTRVIGFARCPSNSTVRYYVPVFC